MNEQMKVETPLASLLVLSATCSCKDQVWRNSSNTIYSWMTISVCILFDVLKENVNVN